MPDNYTSNTPSDDAQSQELLASYPAIAQQLLQSASTTEAEETLAPLLDQEDEVQLAFLKALGKERTSEAADVALALHLLSPLKAVRKEARSTLVRLESAGIYAEWDPPTPKLSDALELYDEDEIDATTKRAASNAFAGINSFLGEVGLFSGPAYLDTVTAFLESWGEANFEDAYDMLADESPLRAGLSREIWVEQRKRWEEQAEPDTLRITFLNYRSSEQDAIDEDDEDLDEAPVPTIEVGWSIELIETPLAKALPEIPSATVSFAETDRHWFWCRYTLVQEDGEWRIDEMIDEGDNILRLSTEELRTRMESITTLADQRLNELTTELAEGMIQEAEKLENEEDEKDEEEETKDGTEIEDEDEDEKDEEEQEDLAEMLLRMEEAICIITRGMHYHDALLTRAPGNIELYQRNIAHATAMNDAERSAAYLEQLFERAPEMRNGMLLQLARMYTNIAERYEEEENEDGKEHFVELAEETLREAIQLNPTAAAYIRLAMLLFQEEGNLEETRSLLQQARRLNPDEDESIEIEAGIANIAVEEGEYEQALAAYKRVAQLDPEYPDLALSTGAVLNRLERYKESLAFLLPLREEEPENSELSIELSIAYAGQGNLTEAREVLREALEWDAESVEILTQLSLVYVQGNDLRSAQKYFERAEQIDDEHPLVEEMRALLKQFRSQSRQKNTKKSPRKRK